MEKKIKGKKIKLDIKEQKKDTEKKETTSIKTTKTSKKIVKKDIKNKELSQNKLSKQRIFFISIAIIDIIITIYFARRNIANYVRIEGAKEAFIGENKTLMFGRNYINIITALFFSIYTCLSNKILFKEKPTKKFIFITIFFYLILNIILFILFTKRVY